MKILFLNPPFIGRFSRASRSPAVAKGGTLYYPIWLSYAAAVCRAAGHETRLIDAPAAGLDTDQTIKIAQAYTPELIVVDTSTPSIYKDIKIAANLKKQISESYVVIVGPHPSALPDESLELDSSIDAVAIGEYDYTICDIADSLENGNSLDKINGLVLRKGNSIVHTPKREKIKHLDKIPFVSKIYKQQLNVHNYFFAAANYPMVMIITGRGCPHKCFFCVYPQVFHSRRYRVRSAENVVDEFEYIVNELPDIKEIGIEDDCFTANPKRAKKICDLILERKIKIKWYCNVRGDVDYALLKRMKEAGCRLVTVGFESGSQMILDGMKKGERIERYLQFSADAKKAGLLVHGCIMAGNPGDNKATLEESYSFAKKINCDSMQFYPLYVYPGTEAYTWATEKGYITTTDFSKWLTKDGLHNCVLSTPELNSEELVELCDTYLKKYHLRIPYLWQKTIQAFLNPSEGYRSLKSARVFINKIFSSRI